MKVFRSGKSSMNVTIAGRDGRRSKNHSEAGGSDRRAGLDLAKRVPAAIKKRPLSINQDMKGITPHKGIEA